MSWTGTPLSLGYFIRFTWRLFSTSYLSAGWLRFDPPGWIVGVALAISAVTLIRGVGVSLSADRRARLGALVAIMFVVIQIASIYGTRYYLPDSGAQGRFLFAAIGPWCALCALGLVRWRSPDARAFACCSVIGLLGILDLVSWMTTVVPAYAFWA